MSEIELTKANVLLPNYRGRLLEGVTYNKSNNTLLWVDIIAAEVHRYFFESQVHEVLKSGVFADSIGTIGLTKDNDEIILGNKTGIALGNFKTKAIKTLVKYPENLRVRSNDGKIDPHGNLIVGTMSDFQFDLKPEGTLYKLDKDLKLSVLWDKTQIANGLGFNSSLTKFYWTDSPTHKIYSFDYDKDTQEFSNKQVFFDTEVALGDPECVPDGMCITEKDEVFTCVFNGSVVIQINEQGQILNKYKLPALRITCCTVGGVNDDELFITTAHEFHEDMAASIDLSEEGDLGGHLFKIKLNKPCKEIQYIWKGH